MRSFLTVLGFVALTFLCWGVYGPVLHVGQYDMGVPMQPSSLRPFICVGIAYFVIAVVVPVVWLRSSGESGHWTVNGAVWSFAAGAAGALGALGIILAFKFRGSPVYVMPLVFGCAPVVNTFVTMWMARTYKQASFVFYAGIVIVAVGAAGVLVFKPSAKNIEIDKQSDGSIVVALTEVVGRKIHTDKWTAANEQELKTEPDLAKAYKLYVKKQPLTISQRIMIALSVALTALCWGSYGPVLHKGQMKMAGSRLRPLLCVGLAYFAIAVVVPLILLPLAAFQEQGGWTTAGVIWSLAAGAAGAVGALGIIMAFNLGGKPIYVMPLVFGCAPVVNTLTTIVHEGTFRQIDKPFYVALLLVIIGAVTVLVFSPKPQKKPADAPHDTSEKGEPKEHREVSEDSAAGGRSEETEKDQAAAED